MPPAAAPLPILPRADILAAVERYWGYSTLRPIQEDAIRAGIDGRDSVVVMPTGGGKSLCYQVPPLVTGRMAVVASPLISLMKDQVDGLKLAGYPAAALHSNISPEEVFATEQAALAGRLKLLFVAPERLLTPRFLGLVARLKIESFAIDEAHCISQWGHDFRPEYRRLAELRRHFPGASFHAYTATATERVRQDIIDQLELRDPAVLVGRFDRPNLTYRVLPRLDSLEQLVEIIGRHTGGKAHGEAQGTRHRALAGEDPAASPACLPGAQRPAPSAPSSSSAVIVYCISRKDTEDLAAQLSRRGLRAGAYHAGLYPAVRQRVQEDFANERLNIVVATVAFGMGIDRSNVRCVVHAAMPKSIEAYQQETGRAGRDGLDSECVLLYSSQDVVRWNGLIARSAAESEASPESVEAQRVLLDRIHRFASGGVCRHRALSEYFGQHYDPPAPFPPGGTGCSACDVCLGELQPVADATTIARKILSCVVRVGQSFGAAHVVDVLRGSNLQKIRDRGHDRLSTFGLLKGTPREVLLSYVNQLIDHGVLARSAGEFPVLVLSADSAAALRGQREIALVTPKHPEPAHARQRYEADAASPLAPEESGLFEALRALRRGIAEKRGVPPYVVFSDATLQEMARIRPTTPDAMVRVKGVGETKLETFGPAFLEAISAYCSANVLGVNVGGDPRRTEKFNRRRQSAGPRRGWGGESGGEAAGGPGEEEGDLRGQRLSGTKALAFTMFEDGESLETVAGATGRAQKTVAEYLADFIEIRRPRDISRWVDDATYVAVTQAAPSIALQPLRPIFEALGEKVPYDAIRLVMTHRRSRSGS